MEVLENTRDGAQPRLRTELIRERFPAGLKYKLDMEASLPFIHQLIWEKGGILLIIWDKNWMVFSYRMYNIITFQMWVSKDIYTTSFPNSLPSFQQTSLIRKYIANIAVNTVNSFIFLPDCLSSCITYLEHSTYFQRIKVLCLPYFQIIITALNHKKCD